MINAPAIPIAPARQPVDQTEHRKIRDNIQREHNCPQYQRHQNKRTQERNDIYDQFRQKTSHILGKCLDSQIFIYLIVIIFCQKIFKISGKSAASIAAI